MKLGWFGAALCGWLAFAGVPAVAQSDPFELVRSGEPSSPRDIRILHDFARCVADRRPNQARSLLAMDFTTASYRLGMMRIGHERSSCLRPGRLGTSQLLFAGGLAEALLRTRFARGGLAAWTAHDPSRPPLRSRSETETMSLCTVRAAPAQVAALLATRPASRSEAAAIDALLPQVGRCLAAATRLRLNRPAIRSLLALAAYRLSEHNAGGVSAGR